MIEISDGRAEYLYRLNPYQARIIDRKLNVARARWVAYEHFDTEEAAIAALTQLYRKDTPR